MLRKVLLACGVAYGVLYVIVNDAIAATFYDGYSRLSQAVSELSATGAPTRLFLQVWAPIGCAVLTAFGIGVWMSARGRRALRAAGGILVAFGVTGLLWLPFPMSSRDDMVKGATSWNDVGHIAMTVLTFIFTMSLFAAGAAAYGKRFKLYTLATALTMLVFGGLTGIDSAKLPDGATPWMGFYERISIGAWLLWMAVLAIMLLRERSAVTPTAPVSRQPVPALSVPGGPTPPVSQPDPVPSSSAPRG